MSIFDEHNRLTAEALADLGTHADMVKCECPTHLIKILGEVRAFAKYSLECGQANPADAKTHKWLYQSAMNHDSLLSATIAQLARIEGFVDENNNFTGRAQK